MTAAIVIIGLLTVLFLILVGVGIRSRMVLVNPGALSDRQIQATADITRRIMERSRPGSPTWTRAAAKHKAAVDEQLRRSGRPAHEEVELVEPNKPA